MLIALKKITLCVSITIIVELLFIFSFKMCKLVQKISMVQNGKNLNLYSIETAFSSTLQSQEESFVLELGLK